MGSTGVRRIVCTGVVTLAACGDGTTGPELEPYGLVITGPSIEQPHHTKPGASWLVTCSPVVTLQPTGDVAGVAEFGTAVVRLSGAFDGSFLGAVNLSAAAVAELWGQPTVSQRITRRFEIGASAPFALELSFNYTVNGVAGSVEYMMSCAPPVPPPSGRWALASINGQTVPATPVTGIEVVYDSLTFAANLTYRSKSERFGGTPMRPLLEDFSEHLLEVRTPTVLVLPRLSQRNADPSVWEHPTITFSSSEGDVYVYRPVVP